MSEERFDRIKSQISELRELMQQNMIATQQNINAMNQNIAAMNQNINVDKPLNNKS